MSEDVFADDVNEIKKALSFHKKLDVCLGVVTFGLCRNKKKIVYYEKELLESQQNLKRFSELKEKAVNIEKMLSEIIEFDGVRVSKHTFADLTAVQMNKYGIDWDVLRREILERDDYQCQEEDGLCNGPLNIHHIMELSRGGSNAPRNLLTLCYYHHCLKHSHMRSQYNANIWR